MNAVINFTSLDYNRIGAVNSQGNSVISAWDIQLLKSEINAIDTRIRNEIIEKILDLCILNDPDFEIHQIKLKFGGIRFYVQSNVIEDIFDVESLIENTFYDRALIF